MLLFARAFLLVGGVSGCIIRHFLFVNNILAKIDKISPKRHQPGVAMSEIVIYDDGNFSIEISIENETLWLSTEQIAMLLASIVLRL